MQQCLLKLVLPYFRAPTWLSVSLTEYHWKSLSSKAKEQERSLSILQVYAPNIESQCEAFLEEVEVALGKATSSESLVLLGDFNAHVGINNATWKGVIGQHGDPDIHKNGRCLLQFCATNGLCIINTFF